MEAVWTLQAFPKGRQPMTHRRFKTQLLLVGLGAFMACGATAKMLGDCENRSITPFEEKLRLERGSNREMAVANYCVALSLIAANESPRPFTFTSVVPL